MASDEFEAITENAPLVADLRARIESRGPITFREFMHAALYDPRFGYYTTHAHAMTRGGDYVTSPEVHPIFGALVAKQVIEVWAALGRPNRFHVVELGGGGGLLARDMLARTARDAEFDRAVRYRIVERSPRRPSAKHARRGRDVRACGLARRPSRCARRRRPLQ
jgi:SAM-dependent MidA family methyltransferase